MKDDPPSLDDLVATYGHPADGVLEIHAQTERQLVEAEATGDKAEVRQLRALLKRSQRLIDRYGLKR